MAVDIVSKSNRHINNEVEGTQASVLQLHYGADLICDCALTLKLSASTCALSLTVYHRFYLYRTAYEKSPVWIACAALLLAIKHDSVSRKLCDVATAMHATLRCRESWAPSAIENDNDTDTPLDYFGAAGYTWKAEIVKAEHQVLHSIGFRVLHETPHKLVLVFCNTLREKSSIANGWDALVRRAWALANDIMRISASVTSRCDDIACACIARSAASSEVALQLPANWMAVFGATKSAMQKVDAAFEILYRAPSLRGRFEDLANAAIRKACAMPETPTRATD